MANQGVLRRFLRNIASNTAGYFVSVAIALALSPFVVHTLGDKFYGLWTLVISLTGYYGLLDLGIKSAVGQYVSRYWAKRDIDGVNRTLNTAFVLLCGVALLAMVVTAVLAWLLPHWIDAKGTALAAAQGALVITGLEISLGFPMAVYSTATYARERFDIDNAVGITLKLLAAGLWVLVLKAGYGILGLACVQAGVAATGWTVRFVIAHRLMPGLRFAPRLFSRASVREIGSYGVFSFLINAADRIIDFTDAIIIGIFLPVAAITYYAIGANLVPYYLMLIRAMTWTMTPYATACDVRGDRDALRRLYLNGTRGTLFVAAVVGAGLLLLGHDFLATWMGERYVSGAEYASSATILSILTLGAFVRCAQSCGRQVLFGARRVRFLAAISFLEAASNIVLSLILIRSIALPGVALGSVIPVLVLTGVVQTIYIVSMLELSWGRVVANFVRSAAPVMAAMAGMHWLADAVLTQGGWAGLILRGLVTILPVPVVGLFVVMTRDERRSVLGRFFPGRDAK